MNLPKTTTAPIAKGTKSTSRLVGLAAEVMVNPSNNRRLRDLYTRGSPNVSSLLDQQRPLGEMKKMNRITRYNSVQISAREEARPVGAKLQENRIRFETSPLSTVPTALTVCDNTKRYPIVARDFAIVSDIGLVGIWDRIPEGANSDSVVGDDGP